MKKVKLNTADERMLQLRDILKQRGDITYMQEFCDTIGFYKQSIRNVKIGKQHFTINHIYAACRTYKINANWILGLEDINAKPFLPLTKKTTIFLKNTAKTRNEKTKSRTG